MFTNLTSKTEGARDQYAKFAIELLNCGQGITLANALRRTMLTDFKGTAIVAVRIAGIDHEFSTIPGVREDVLEILLNLKQVVLKSSSDEPQMGKVKIQGPAIVTASSFELPLEVVVVDPSQYIATICSNTIFEIEFRIEKGHGYRIVDKGIDNISIDFLQIDAIFMPVKKVNYDVEELLDNSTIKDKVFLEVWTNGSISPDQAISYASEILTQLFDPLRNLEFKQLIKTVSTNSTKINQVPIEELQLSVRAYNCLKRAQIHSVADLLEYSQEELLEIRNFGQKSAEEVIEALEHSLDIKLPKEKSNR
uniref:DNA-directed RNA polymerase subunit alpha n=1 Tax=Corynoplastis japonica TaxID=700918 RepID=A0A1X9PTZ8_9RHOD|nr:DNA-directed RNA polymerase subunit alpha [Corynoplastis japonica]